MQNIIERGLILSHGSILELENDLMSVSTSDAHRDKAQEEVATQTVGPSALKTLEDVERAHISARPTTNSRRDRGREWRSEDSGNAS